MVCGIEDFVGIESWGKERIDWLRRFLVLENGIPSHDTLGHLFALLRSARGRKKFSSMESVLPSLSESRGPIDGKASRHSRKAGQQPLLLVSSFAREARLILGQEACVEESNEWTAIPILLESLMLKGVIVTLDAMGTHSLIAKAIRAKEVDYVLAVKDNQPKLAESITDFFATGQAARWQNTWHRFVETVEKDHGRLEVQRYWTFLQLEGLSEPQHRNRGMI